MKKSRRVALTFLGSMAMAIAPVVAACGGHASSQVLHCVDPNDIVVQEANCNEATPRSGGSPGLYHWYYGGHGFVPTGSRISGGSAAPSSGASYHSSAGTVRGGLGSTSHAGGGKSGS
jgi:hypothetical protein